MATQHRVQLVFSGTAVEVAAEGDLDALKHQVEASLSLQPDTYGLFDTCGEVATPAALRRTLHAVGEDICRLEVRERPEWKRMREIGGQLQALEHGILCKVEGMISDLEGRLRMTEVKVDRATPLLETLAIEQINTRKKVEGLDTSLRPLLQSLAQELIDLKAEPMKDPITNKIEELAQAEAKLQKELANLWQSTRSVQDDIGGLQKKFSELNAKAIVSSPKSSPKASRVLNDALKERAQPTTVDVNDTEVAWPDSMSASTLFAYSTKSLPLGDTGSAFRIKAAPPFVRGDPGARLRERRMLPPGSCSVPNLPPLQA